MILAQPDYLGQTWEDYAAKHELYSQRLERSRPVISIDPEPPQPEEPPLEEELINASEGQDNGANSSCTEMTTPFNQTPEFKAWLQEEIKRNEAIRQQAELRRHAAADYRMWFESWQAENDRLDREAAQAAALRQPNGTVSVTSPSEIPEFSVDIEFVRVTEKVGNLDAINAITEIRQRMGLDPSYAGGDVFAFMENTYGATTNGLDLSDPYNYLHKLNTYVDPLAANTPFLPNSKSSVEVKYSVGGKLKTNYHHRIDVECQVYVTYLVATANGAKYPIDVSLRFEVTQTDLGTNQVYDEKYGSAAANNKFYNAVEGLSLGVTLGSSAGVIVGFNGDRGNITVANNPNTIHSTQEVTFDGDVLTVSTTIPESFIQILGTTSFSDAFVESILVSGTLPDAILGIPLQPNETAVCLPTATDQMSTLPTYEGMVKTKVTNVKIGPAQTTPVTRTTYFVKSAGSDEWVPISGSKYRELSANSQVISESRVRE